MATAAFIAARKTMLAALEAAYQSMRGVVNPANKVLENAVNSGDIKLMPLVTSDIAVVNALISYHLKLLATIAETDQMVAEDWKPPIDAGMSDWSLTRAAAWTVCEAGIQTRLETWNRTVTTPAENGGITGALEEFRIATQACVVVPPPPPPPPPDGDPWVVLIGTGGDSIPWVRADHDHRNGPADRAKLSVLKAAIAAQPAWDVFEDDLQHVSKSRNGGPRPTDVIVMPVWGNVNRLYQQTPRMDGDRSRPLYVENELDFKLIMSTSMKNGGMHDGKRGNNLTTPFTSWHGHPPILRPDETVPLSPRAPQWIGMQFDGTMVFLFRDGSSMNVFKIPGVNAATDWSYLDVGDRKIFFFVDSLNKRVLAVDRHAAIPGSGAAVSPPTGFEFFEKWQVKTLAEGFVKPISICEMGGDLYVTDLGYTDVTTGDGWLYKVDHITGEKTKIINIPGLFWINATSDNQFIVTTLNLQVYKVDPVAKTHGPDLMGAAKAGHTSQAYVTVSVDRKGTWGPVDEFAVSCPVGPNNISVWRYQDGVMKYRPFKAGMGEASCGNSNFCADESGHYPWLLEHHPQEAIMLAHGIAGIHPSLLVAKPSNYPEEGGYDLNLSRRGRDIIWSGTVSGVPYHTGGIGSDGAIYKARPTFTSQLTDTCWSLIGCTCDFIAAKPWAEQVVFIRQGMLGSVHRPEIKGLDMYAILYLINRSSMQFLKKGKAHMDALAAFCKPMLGMEMKSLPGQEPGKATWNTQPYYVGTDGKAYGCWLCDMRQEGDKLQLHAASFPYNYPVIADPTLIVRVIIDEGWPEERDMGTLTSPWTLPIPALAKGQHSAMVHPVSAADGLAKYHGRATVVIV